MADVFISFANEDRATADRLSDELTAKGYDVWYAGRLLPGEKWRRRIKTEIERADSVLVLWSPHSVRSTFVLSEADKANTLEKLVIPAKIPGLRDTDIPLDYSEIQTCLATDVAAIIAALSGNGIAPSLRAAEAAPVSAKEHTAQRIFRSAIPELTLIDRKKSNEGIEIADKLLDTAQCIRLCGPTRSGKSVLIDQVMEEQDAFYLSGGVITGIHKFYEFLAVQLKPALPPETSDTLVLQTVFEAGRPIVIDDYHRINPQTRKAIIRQLQSFLDRNILVVLVSWTDIDGEIIEKDPGIGGRSEMIEMSPWRQDEIKKIGLVGFGDGLNVMLDARTLAAIVEHSYLNPSLMQQHCFEVAAKAAVLRPQPKRQTIGLSEEQLRDIFVTASKKTAANFNGSIESKADPTYELTNGRKTTEFGLILIAVRDVAPIHSTTPQNIAPRMRASLKDGDWMTAPQAELALRRFMERLAKHPHRHTAIDFANGKVHIHPFFKRYIRWSFLPSKGYPYPTV